MNPDTDTHRHTLFVGIFCTKVQMQYSGGKIAIQQMMLGQLDSLGQKEKENEWHNVILSFTIYTINPKWITDLNVKCKVTKILREKAEKIGGLRTRQWVLRLNTRGTIDFFKMIN